MTRKNERVVALGLWTAYGVFAIVGLLVLAEALFVRRAPRPLVLPALPKIEAVSTLPALFNLEGLASQRMSRRLEGRVAPAVGKTVAPGLDSMIRLTGIMDFGGKKPALAVIENLSASDSKAYKNGDQVGETGVVVREIGEAVIVEFEKRRYKLTFKGIQELPPRALGSVEGVRTGD